MALAKAALTASAAAIYTSSGNSAVTTIYFCNYSGSDRTVTVHLVASGDSADNTNIIYQALPVVAGDTYVLDTEKVILANGDTIQALASATSSIAASVSYIGV